MTTLDRESIDTPSPTAVLDSAHVGDIEGALGRIRLSGNDRPRTLKTRLATLLAIVGPGLIVMVGQFQSRSKATGALSPADWNTYLPLTNVAVTLFKLATTIPHKLVRASSFCC